MVSVVHRINAAFGVSNKFIPYRPNYDLVCKSVGTLIDVPYTSQAADTYEATSISIPLNTNKMYEVLANVAFNNSEPYGIIIAKSGTVSTQNTDVLAENSYQYTGGNGRAATRTVSLLCRPQTANTLYIWVKYKEANKQNYVTVLIRELN